MTFKLIYNSLFDESSLTQIRKLNKGYEKDFDWKILDENYYNNNSFKSIKKNQ